MTIVAPYSYIWSANNNTDYVCPNLSVAVEKIGLKAATAAFIIGDGRDGLWQVVTDSLPDLKKFVDNKGLLIMSCGGASGPFLEDTLSEDALFTVLDNLYKTINCYGFDFDVEGGSIGQTAVIDKRNKVIRRLQQKYPKLYISYTLAVQSPQWGAFPQSALDLLKNAVKNNVRVDVVNAMTMDLYGSMAKSWGQTACDILDSMKTQIAPIYPQKSEKELYAMLGATFMAGVNDDNTVFNLSDAKILTDFAITKKIGLLSYWALQRDQAKQGALGVSSKIAQKDFDFYNICKTAMSNQPPVINPPAPTPLPPAPIPVPPVPAPVPNPTPISGIEWQVGKSYKKDDQVSYKDLLYLCQIPHISIESWIPSVVPALWKLIGPVLPPRPVPPTPTNVKYPVYIDVSIKPVPVGKKISQIRMGVKVNFLNNTENYTLDVTTDPNSLVQDAVKPYPKYPLVIKVPMPKTISGKILKQMRMGVVVDFNNDSTYTVTVTTALPTYV